MAIGAWLGTYRVDPVGKADGGIGSSWTNIVESLQPSNYHPEARRRVPLLWATLIAQLLVFIAGVVVLFGA
jgi:hypothetical protein